MQPLLQWKSNEYYIFWACVCSLRYSARNAHAQVILSSVDWPALLCFSTLSHKMYDFRKKKKVTKYKICVLIFSKTSIWNVSHSAKNWARCDKKKCILVLMKSTRYSCQIVMKLEFSRHVFEKCSNIKLLETPASGSRVVPRGQSDRQTCWK